MSELNRIVEIVITRDTKALSSANFSTPLLVSKTAKKAGVCVYRSPKDLLADGYLSTDVEYQASVAHFLVENHPPEFKVGKQETGDDISTTMYKLVDLDNQFYGVLLADIDGDYDSLAFWCDSNDRFLFAGEADADGLATLTAINLKAVKNVMCFANTALRSDGTGFESWSPVQGFADVSFASTILGKTIGSYTTVYKNLKGMRVDSLTATQQTAIENLNGTYYIEVYGEKLTMGGRCADGSANGKGEWIDVEIGIDWNTIRMQEAVFKSTVRADKIPYTDKGTAIYESDVRTQLEQAVKQGVFTTFTITREPVSEQPEADRLARRYEGLSWDAVLAGAIHSTKIYGNVRV